LGILLPTVLSYAAVLGCWYYVFVMVGMEIFGDLITDYNIKNGGNCNNPDLDGSYFAGFVIFNIF
jgi:hypothetical protein